MRPFVVGTAYAIWLTAVAIVFYLVPHDNPALELTVIAGVMPLVLQIFLLGFDPVGLVGPARLSLSFFAIVLLSYIFNRGNSESLTFVGELVYVFTLAIILAGCPDERLLRMIGSVFSVLLGVFCVYIGLTGSYLWGRLTAGLQPNTWGLFGFAVVATAFAHRSRLLRAACIGMGLYTIYVSSTRSSLVAFAVVGSIIALCHLSRAKNWRLASAFGATAVLLTVLIIFEPYFQSALPAFLDDLLKLDDPYRGIGQGFTGRDTLWDAALDLWMGSPIFGVGFRQHEVFMPFNLSAHNAYLAMLVDTGVLGLMWYAVFIIGSALAAFSIADTRTRDMGIAVIIGYAVIGLFERRAINGGNPLSILFIILCFYAQAQSTLWRAGRQGRAAGWVGIPSQREA